MVQVLRLSPSYFICSFDHLIRLFKPLPSLHSNELALNESSIVIIQEEIPNAKWEK
jgi:hypothetical protein